MAREWEGPAGSCAGGKACFPVSATVGGRDRTEGPYLQEALPGGHVLDLWNPEEIGFSGPVPKNNFRRMGGLLVQEFLCLIQGIELSHVY